MEDEIMVYNLNFENVDIITFIGDIHGEFKKIVYKITQQYSIKNSVFVLLGDVGIGFEKIEYYQQLFNNIENKLKKGNNHIILGRGNHDDPSYFNNEEIRNKFDKYHHIHLISDYTIITINNVNILYVGGATSIDRICRKEKMKLNKQPLYWEDEGVVLDTEKLDKINKEFPNQINILASHTCMSWEYPTTKNEIDYWMAKDKQLSDDLDKERLTMDSIYQYLLDIGQNNITHHYYGHFHKYKSYEERGLKCMLLDIGQIIEHRL